MRSSSRISARHQLERFTRGLPPVSTSESDTPPRSHLVDLNDSTGATETTGSTPITDAPSERHVKDHMDPRSPPPAASADRTSTVRLTEKVFEIKAADRAAEKLLETIDKINGRLEAAKTLRDQKSHLLHNDQAEFITTTFESTTQAIRDVAELVEPCHVSMEPKEGTSGTAPKLMFVLRETPKIHISMEQLKTAGENLEMVLIVLSNGDSTEPGHPPHTRPQIRTPPSHELDQLLTASRTRNMARRRTINATGDAGIQVKDHTNSLAKVQEVGHESDELGSIQPRSETQSLRSSKSANDELFFDHEDQKQSYPSIPYRPAHASSASLNSSHQSGQLPPSLRPGLFVFGGPPSSYVGSRYRTSSYVPTSRTLSPTPMIVQHRQSAPVTSNSELLESMPSELHGTSAGTDPRSRRFPSQPRTLSPGLGISRVSENAPSTMLPAIQPQSPLSPFIEDSTFHTPPDFQPPSITSPYFRSEDWGRYPALRDDQDLVKHDSVLSRKSEGKPSSPDQLSAQDVERQNSAIRRSIPHRRSPRPPRPSRVLGSSPRPSEEAEDSSRRNSEPAPPQLSIPEGLSTFVLAFDTANDTAQPLLTNMVKLDTGRDCAGTMLQSVPVNMVNRSASSSAPQLIKAALESEFPELVTDEIRMESFRGARLESEFPELVTAYDTNSAPEAVEIITEVSKDVIQRARTRRRQNFEAHFIEQEQMRDSELITLQRMGPPVKVDVQSPPVPATRRWSENDNIPAASRSSVSLGSESSQTPAISGKARSQRWRELQYERFQQLPRG